MRGIVTGMPGARKTGRERRLTAGLSTVEMFRFSITPFDSGHARA